MFDKLTRISLKLKILGLFIAIMILTIILLVSYKFILEHSINENEKFALKSMKTIAAAQIDYLGGLAENGFSPNLEKLHTGEGAGDIGWIDAELSSGLKSGYTFILTPGESNSIGIYWTWSAACWPVKYGRTGFRSFYLDQSCIIRGSDIGGKPGIKEMPPLKE